MSGYMGGLEVDYETSLITDEILIRVRRQYMTPEGEIGKKGIAFRIREEDLVHMAPGMEYLVKKIDKGRFELIAEEVSNETNK